MTAGPTGRLSSQQTLRSLHGFDLLELLAERLTSRDHDETGRAEPASGQTVVEEPVTGVRCLLPTATLRMIRPAGWLSWPPVSWSHPAC